MSLLFSIVGDSNIKRHMTPMNCRDRPMMTSAQTLTCGRLEVLAESFKQIRAETNVCLLSCVTNFLTSSEGSSTVSLRVEPIFIDFLSKLETLATERPDLKLLVCPPMYRESPIWYRENLSQILTKFSEVFSRNESGILLMPSFPTPSLETDGVHLTAYSGLEFVLHLFDNAKSIIESIGSDLETKSGKSAESTRVLEDRVMAIEQDHRRLNSLFEWKTAIDCELQEFQENVRFESWFVISGLAKIESKMDRKEWQTKAKSDVNSALSVLMGREYPIIVVQNITSMAKDAFCRYQVLLTSVSDSKEIRDKFGAFFLGGGDRRPEALKKISIQNRITTGTQLRIAILQLLGKRYLSSNPGGKVYVIRHESRPQIKITPPENASDRKIQTFNYIEAIKNLPVNFRQSELKPILEKVNVKLKGSLKSVFVVVSDDMLPRQKPKPKPKGHGSGGSAGDASGSSSGARGSKRGPSVSPSDSTKSSKSSRK